MATEASKLDLNHFPITEDKIKKIENKPQAPKAHPQMVRSVKLSGFSIPMPSQMESHAKCIWQGFSDNSDFTAIPGLGHR